MLDTPKLQLHLARIFFGCLVLACLAGTAKIIHADDLFPPPWRGLPRTTLAEWEFLTPSVEGPDGPNAPVVGDGGGTPTVEAISGIVWSAEFGGSLVGNNGGGTLQFYIPNWIDTLPWKDLWVQITYRPGESTAPPQVSNIVTDDDGTMEFLGASDFLLNPQLNLRHRSEFWRLYPNPNWERFDINLSSEVAVTQVVVDTWSVPEPSSLALAMLSGFAFVTIGFRRFWRNSV